MNINFSSPTQLFLEDNSVLNNKEIMKSFGSKAVIITSGSAGKKSGALEDVETALSSLDIQYIIHDSVQQNPLLDDAFDAGKKARSFGADFIVGIGGGSPLDAAKAAAIYASNPELEPMELYDLNWSNRPLPLVAVGTTAGTGSEVGHFSVLSMPNGRKRSIAHRDCYPAVAFSDPKYTSSLSYNFTVSTALDALSHALEGFYCTSANNISDMFSFEAIRTLITEFGELKDGGEITLETRKQLLYASIMAGYTLDICGTLYCHAVGYFLSEEHNIPHGNACAVFLPSLLDRQKNLLPERAALLESATGITHDKLASLIMEFVPELDIVISTEKSREIVDSKIDTNNFKHTAPSGISAHEVYEIMDKTFNIN